MLCILAPLWGGCSYRLGAMFGSESSNNETTGSSPAAISKEVSEPDLAPAKAAVAEAMSKDGAGSTQWDDPRTGAHGAITPIARAYTQDGLTCRDFLVSHIREGHGESWLEGEACRLPQQANWEVRALKPLKR